MMNKFTITPDDIMPMEEYEKVRNERRARITELKRDRRIECGPDATFYFESYDTMWHQIHEMLYIEKGGTDQINDELLAYNPLIPNGSELVATVMFEVDDPTYRASLLAMLGGVEETIILEFGTEKIICVPEKDLDRTTAAGKASAVQFVHFPMTSIQVEKFKNKDVRPKLSITHPKYFHNCTITGRVHASLINDLT